MTKFETDLLKQAFENYRRKGNSSTLFQAKNGDEWFYYGDAFASLAEREFIVILDDFNPDRTNAFASTFEYELTEQGLNYAKSTLVD